MLSLGHCWPWCVQVAKRHSVEQLIADASSNPQVNPKYLRVMLLQFLQSDVTVRREKELQAQWAQKVYEIDPNEHHRDSQRIPSAWKVYFRTALENAQ